MLEHLKAGHDIELGRTLSRKRFGRTLQVIDLGTRLHLVQTRYPEWLFCHIDPGNNRAPGRHGLGQNPTTAADIHHVSAMQLCALTDEIETQRVDLVQGPKIAFGVPPARCQRIELVDFRRIDILIR